MARRVKRQSGKTALLLGVGYTARALIPLLRSAGYNIVGTSRNPEDVPDLGIKMVKFAGVIDPELKDVLGRAHIILSSIAARDDGDPFLNALVADGNQSPLISLAPMLEWAGYLSATSVYGDRAGHWAFEDELLRPQTQRGKNRVEAELAWLETGAPVHVFRLAGIYGPDIRGMSRNPFSRIIDGTARAVIKTGHLVNRIYVKDIASAVMASINTPNPAMVYNLADDEPAPPQNVINFAADLIGAPRPAQINHDSDELSAMAKSFYSETKRVSNARAKAQLGWAPQYPNYRAGLMAAYKNGQDKKDLVILSGHISAAPEDVSNIKAALPRHINQTRAEPGCLRFDVSQDGDDPRIFHVLEMFKTPEAFHQHQSRAQNSDWAKISQSTKRHYDIAGMS